VKIKYQDFSFEEVCRAAEDLCEQGWDVHQKFTCSGCGNRLTIEEPNVFHRTGTCDRCHAVTDIENQGCNYMLIGKFTER
jgi:hypothetical protein